MSPDDIAKYLRTHLQFFTKDTPVTLVTEWVALIGGLDQSVAIPNDLLFQTDRHGINVYLSSWLPLFTRTRRP